ncbi:MAG: LptF/LptG family permease [Candidatus Omnitrophica bacterium]|nr:LptF/LptG family permease [Candidatus Omnitrophota bacterium]
MRILDRYINNSILKIFLAATVVFCVIYIIVELACTVDEIIDRKIPVNILVTYYLSFLPNIFVLTASIACLISVLFTFSSLNNSNEIIVMRSCGMSFWQITRSALVFGLIVSGFVFLVNEKIVPQSNVVTNKIREQNMILQADRKTKNQKINNLTFYGLQNRLYYIDAFNPETFEMEGITIVEYTDKQEINQKIVALKGEWTGIAWKFVNCQITAYSLEQKNEPVKIKVYPEKLMDIKENPQDFLKQRVDVNAMDIKQLNDYIKKFAKSGATRAINNLKVDLHQKISSPFGAFVIILIGLPFALMIKGRKGATFSAFAIAMAIGFSYHVVNALAVAFGKSGALPPIAAAWLTPLIFTIVALIIIEVDF